MAITALLGLVLAPIGAEARMGKGGSFGSRGSRTFTAPPATPTAPRSVSPIQRSTAPASTGAQPRSAAPAPRRGFLGGLLGAGLLGALFGAGFFGGLGALASILGLVLQIGLIVIVARLAFSWFASRRMQPAGAAARPGMARMAAAPPPGATAQAQATPANAGSSNAIPAIGPDDYNAFEQLLILVQQAATNEDAGGLRNITTPEMAGYLGEELAGYQRDGVANRMTGTKLLQGDLAEAWSEGPVEFATVAMRFSAIDTMVDRATNRVVSGDPDKPVEATELWTFQRTRDGEPADWLLSAIQQAG
jgi:predicted lipid-binding transport protein (Tim44 family)